MIKNFQKIVYVLAFTFTSWCLSRTLVFFKSEVAPSTYEYRGENMSLTFFLLTNEEEELIKWKQIWPLFPFRPSMGLACQVPETKKCKPSLDKKKKKSLVTWDMRKQQTSFISRAKFFSASKPSDMTSRPSSWRKDKTYTNLNYQRRLSKKKMINEIHVLVFSVSSHILAETGWILHFVGKTHHPCLPLMVNTKERERK